MFALGETLHEARVRRGLSLADVEAELRIRTRYLSALEEERWEVLPGTAYTRAFLRGYAEFLELDGDVFVSEYAARVEPDDEPEELAPAPAPVSRRLPRPHLDVRLRLVAVAAVVVAAAAGLLALGLTSQSSGSGNTAAPPAQSTSTAATTTATRPAAPAPAPKPALAAVAIHAAGAWDPDGDGHEHDADVPKATDGNPATAWTTETYRAGLQKPGVGLLLDAGRTVALRRLVVVTDTPGYTAVVQAGPSATGPFRAVSAPATVGKRTVFTLRSAAERYYVVWITKLDGLAHVNEVEAFRATAQP